MRSLKSHLLLLMAVTFCLETVSAQDVSEQIENTVRSCRSGVAGQAAGIALIGIGGLSAVAGVKMIKVGMGPRPMVQDHTDMLVLTGTSAVSLASGLVAMGAEYFGMVDENELRSLLTEVHTGVDGIYMNGLLQSCKMARRLPLDCPRLMQQFRDQVKNGAPCESPEALKAKIGQLESLK